MNDKLVVTCILFFCYRNALYIDDDYDIAIQPCFVSLHFVRNVIYPVMYKDICCNQVAGCYFS